MLNPCESRNNQVIWTSKEEADMRDYEGFVRLLDDASEKMRRHTEGFKSRTQRDELTTASQSILNSWREHFSTPWYLNRRLWNRCFLARLWRSLKNNCSPAKITMQRRKESNDRNLSVLCQVRKKWDSIECNTCRVVYLISLLKFYKRFCLKD